jgi:hypothetical protein
MVYYDASCLSNVTASVMPEVKLNGTWLHMFCGVGWRKNESVPSQSNVTITFLLSQSFL